MRCVAVPGIGRLRNQPNHGESAAAQNTVSIRIVSNRGSGRRSLWANRRLCHGFGTGDDRTSPDDVLHDVPFHVGQAHVAAGVIVGQLDIV